MSSFKLLYFVIFIINLYKIDAQISDKRLCVDEECKVPISFAKTLLRYSSPDSRILSFAPNADITIYSKSAGSREDLWGGEINGKRGYVPKHMVRETKILQKPTLLVDTEFSNDTESTKVPSNVEPDKVQEPYEVIDGTTIYSAPQDTINPTVTDSPVQSTALPVTTEKPETATAEVAASEETPANVKQEEQTEEIQSQEASEAEEQEDEEDEEETEDEEAEVTEDEDANEERGEPVADLLQEEETVSEQTPVQPEVLQSTLDASSEPPVEPAEVVTNAKLDANQPLVEEKVSETTDQALPNQETELPKTQLNESASEEVVEQNSSVSAETGETVVETPTSSPEIISGAEAVTDETVANIEVTTLSPEIDIPQPFETGFDDVTPDPVESVTEEANAVENSVPTLPPLGLFNHNNQIPDNVVSTENENDSKEEQASEETELSKDDVEVEETNTITSAEDSPQENSVESTSEENEQPSEEIDTDETATEGAASGFFSSLTSLFGGGAENEPEEGEIQVEEVASVPVATPEEHVVPEMIPEQFCDATTCEDNHQPKESEEESGIMDLFNFSSDIFLYLVTTAVSVIVFLFGYLALDKSKREGPLVAKINKLEKELLIVIKENQILQEKVTPDSGYETNDRVPSEMVETLQQKLTEMAKAKNSLEDHIQNLEKELENSTEVGMELNRMLSEILSSESGSDVLRSNVENLQRQLVEQQSTINSVNETLAITNTENHELRLELELSNKKVLDLQAELDKLLLNILKIEEEKETQQTSLETQIMNYRQKCEEISAKLRTTDQEYNLQVKQLTERLEQTERKLELKMKEHVVLTDNVRQLKAIKNNDGSTLQALLEVSQIKAEIELLKDENQRFSEKLRQEQEARSGWEKRAQSAVEEAQQLRAKYDEADKSKVETETKLEVLSNYFKERETQLQKEISKHESLWVEKQGEATSTTERIQFMQEQLQNYKSQTESLKQEIMSQEVELKSQISVLEKKVHENWVSARQAERKLEEAKQESAQLRHRLTLRERAIQEDKNQHRLQSPIEQNGDMPESPASPPLLFGGRDHITKSPPIPGLPPFLPPPPGVPFMPPPLHGVPPFIPPPPNMFPGDHRPPPLGRMSSPPLNSRYSPSSRGYSPYDRNSSSPSDSEYGASPPQRRGYSPFNSREDRREYKRAPTGRSNGRNILKGGSSGSGNSNESLEKINRQQSKV